MIDPDRAAKRVDSLVYRERHIRFPSFLRSRGTRPVRQPVIGDWFPVARSFARRADDRRSNLVHGVHRPDVVPSSEPVHVALETLLAEFVTDTLAGAFRPGLEALHPVRVDHPADIFPDTVAADIGRVA